MKKLYLLLGMIVSATAVAGSSIDVRQVSPHGYQLTYTGDKTVSVDRAQEILFMPAVEVCAGGEPVYGRYKYRTSMAVSTQVRGRREVFVFVQQIRCSFMR